MCQPFSCQRHDFAVISAPEMWTKGNGAGGCGGVWGQHFRKGPEVWRDGSVVVSTCCSCRGPSSVASTHTRQLIKLCSSHSKDQMLCSCQHLLSRARPPHRPTGMHASENTKIKSYKTKQLSKTAFTKKCQSELRWGVLCTARLPALRM